MCVRAASGERASRRRVDIHHWQRDQQREQRQTGYRKIAGKTRKFSVFFSPRIQTLIA